MLRVVLNDVKKGDCITIIDKGTCRIAIKEDPEIDGLALHDRKKGESLEIFDIQDTIFSLSTL